MELPYDGDTNDSSQYCQHGTFMGSWWGPDYICGWCEDGISVADMGRILAAQAERNRRDKIERLTRLCDTFAEVCHPYSAKVATVMTTYIISETQGMEY